MELKTRKRREYRTKAAVTAYPAAYKLYVIEGVKNRNEIAERSGISRRTLDRWISKYNWNELREKYHTSAIGIYAKLRKMLDEDVQKLQTLDPKSVDKITKVVKTLERMDPSGDKLGLVLEIMEDYAHYLRANDPDAFEMFQKTLPGFLEYARAEYSSRKNN